MIALVTAMLMRLVEWIFAFWSSAPLTVLLPLCALVVGSAFAPFGAPLLTALAGGGLGYSFYLVTLWQEALVLSERARAIRRR